MAYRNGTYIAFDGNDTTDPTRSDMKYYGLLQAWNKNKSNTLTFSDSHKKRIKFGIRVQLKLCKTAFSNE